MPMKIKKGEKTKERNLSEGLFIVLVSLVTLLPRSVRAD